MRALDARSAVWLIPLSAGWACEHVYLLSSHWFLSTSTRFLWLHSNGWGRLTHQAVVTVHRGCKLIDSMDAMMHC